MGLDYGIEDLVRQNGDGGQDRTSRLAVANELSILVAYEDTFGRAVAGAGFFVVDSRKRSS